MPEPKKLRKRIENMKIEILMVVCFLSSTGCWLLDLGLKVNSALLPESTYTKKSWKYLQDSFQETVLIPTVNDIVQELKSNRKNDFIVEFILAIGVVGNLMINIYLGIMVRLMTKKIKNLMKASKAPN